MLKKLIYILLVSLYFFSTNISTTYAKSIDDNLFIPNNITPPEISAKSAILMDITTGKILYSKNENTHHYPASITKILTTLIALEYNKSNDIITFSKDAVFGIDRSSSNLAMDIDEQITMKDALYGIMLMSANEISAAVAEHISGSIDEFAKIMNERAIKAGAINSNFKNSHGLHNPEHFTTAYDMAMISREAYKLPEFREIIGTMTYQIPPTNKQKEIRYLANQHYMYKNTAYYYDGCTGGKMGFTDEAQSTLVTFAERDGLKLVCVVMEEIGNAKYKDTISLFDYGFDNFKIQTLYASDYPELLSVYSENDNVRTFLGKTNIYPEYKNIDVIIPKEYDVNKIIKKINMPEELKSPLNADSDIGSVEFYYNETPIYNIKLKNTQNFEYIATVSVMSGEKLIENNNNIFIFPVSIAILLFVLYFFVRAYKKALRRRRMFIRRKRRLK